MKRKVKILDSIAGLADPKSKDVLDEKYNQLVAQLRSREKPPSESVIKALVDEHKQADRYGQVPIGFAKDWSFKPGDEPLIDAALAEKWEACGICVTLEGKKAA